MKQIFAIVLLVLLTGCESAPANSSGATSDGGDYAQHLRDLANGQPGDQVPTEAQPAPTMPPLPEQPRQVVALPTPQVAATAQPVRPVASVAEAWRDSSKDIDQFAAAVSIGGFIGSPVVMFGLAATVAGLAVRRKVRK